MKFRQIVFTAFMVLIMVSCAQKTCPTYMSLKEFNMVRGEQMEREMSGKRAKKTKRDKWGRIKKPKRKKEQI